MKITDRIKVTVRGSLTRYVSMLKLIVSFLCEVCAFLSTEKFSKIFPDARISKSFNIKKSIRLRKKTKAINSAWKCLISLLKTALTNDKYIYICQVQSLKPLISCFMTRESLVPIKSRDTDVVQRPPPSAFKNCDLPPSFSVSFFKIKKISIMLIKMHTGCTMILTKSILMPDLYFFCKSRRNC